jgi:hypothetical protein
MEIHRTVKKMLTSDWNAMIRHGIVSEQLLNALLANYPSQTAQVVKLMIKYNLLVPLKLIESSDDEDMSNTVPTPLRSYLAPSCIASRE